jgi:hypothetical protein
MFLHLSEGSLGTAFLSSRLAINSCYFLGIHPSQFDELGIDQIPFNDGATKRFDFINSQRELSEQLIHEMDLFDETRMMANIEFLNTRPRRMARKLKKIIKTKLRELREE